MSGDLYSASAMIKRLVDYDTTSRKSNLELIRFVEDYLAAHRIRCHLFYNEARDKAGLFATIGGRGVPDTEEHAKQGGVVLSGHSDVVPVEGQSWSKDPFCCVEKDGRLYGRGTCDMKGFLGTVLAAAPAFAKAKLHRPVHIAITYDEETDLSGAMQLAPAITALGFAPCAAIIGEPTGMRIINAHKGHYHFVTQVTGKDAHASMPHLGANAITASARLMRHLETLIEDERQNADPSFSATPPYTTLNIGVIEGGAQFNMVPGHCRFEWELRTVPGGDGDALVRRFIACADAERDAMRNAMGAPQADITHHCVIRIPAYAAAPDSPAEALIKRLTGITESGAVSYGTEASFFQQNGIAAIVFGPGDIAQAHQPDEYIALSEVEACERFLHDLLEDCARGSDTDADADAGDGDHKDGGARRGMRQ